MAVDDYDEVVSGGGLKLKGADLGKKKKKKKKSSISTSMTEKGKGNYVELARSLVESSSSSQRQKQSGEEQVESEELRVSASSSENPSVNVTRVLKTKAEIKFEEIQKMRLLDKVKKQALKTHKDRVADFNLRLEKQSEHFDIPKVGPGWRELSIAASYVCARTRCQAIFCAYHAARLDKDDHSINYQKILTQTICHWLVKHPGSCFFWPPER